MNSIDFYTKLCGGLQTWDSTNMKSQLIGRQVVQEQKLEFANDEILFGFKENRFTPENAVKLRYDWNSPWFLILIGQPRSGKTATASYFAEQLYLKTGSKIISLDSSKELGTHIHPYAYDKPISYQRNLIAWGRQFGWQPRGFDIVQVIPKFLGDFPNSIKFAWSYGNFKTFFRKKPQDALIILNEMIGGDDSGADLLARGLADEANNSWDDLYNKMLVYRKGMGKEDPLRSTARKVFQGLNSCRTFGYLSDDEKDHIDPMKLIREHEWVNFLGERRKVEDDDIVVRRYNACVKMFFGIYTDDLERKHNGFADAYLDRATILIPELDSAIPKSGTSSLRPTISAFIQKFGKYHLNSVLDTQNLNSIDDNVKPSLSILTNKAESANLSTIKDKGATEYALDMLRNLKVRQDTSIGTSSSQWFYFGKRKDEADTIPLYGYTPPPMSEPYDEKKVNQFAVS